MSILNYTTTISSSKSVSQIQALLVRNGSRKIMIEYGTRAEVAAISFEIVVNQMKIQFRLPANWRGVKKAISGQKKIVAKYKTDEHAINVCWRIIKDWIEAQVAIIEAEQADIVTVFLPYAIMNDGGHSL